MPGIGRSDRDHSVAIAALQRRLGPAVVLTDAVRAAHGTNEAFHAPMAPDAVVFAASTQDIVQVMRVCSDTGTPVIAYGAGTSLEGGVAAVRGGVCIDLSRMDAILEVNASDMDCTVQAGVTREQLNAHLRDTGLFFPIDPGANASLGGMTATRASGTNAVRYGTMKDNVLSVTAVLADGRVIRTARRARKSSAGYDLTRLFVGSEGTLGVISEITLRLHGQPEAVWVMTAAFAGLDDAVNCVIDVLQLAIPVARIELLDPAQIRASNLYSGTDLPERPTLFIELHGSPAGVAEQSQTIGDIAGSHAVEALRFATGDQERRVLWAARHNALYAAKALRSGSEVVVTDVCVPISRLAECIVETHRDIEQEGLVAPIVGHVGDGNFHVFLTLDPADPEEIGRVRRVNDRLVDRAIDMNGTCTGEHGIGLGKREKLIDELGAETVAVMAGIKRQLDPRNILNPGKIFRDAEGGLRVRDMQPRAANDGPATIPAATRLEFPRPGIRGRR